jgi:hypothetical protein
MAFRSSAANPEASRDLYLGTKASAYWRAKLRSSGAPHATISQERLKSLHDVAGPEAISRRSSPTKRVLKFGCQTCSASRRILQILETHPAIRVAEPIFWRIQARRFAANCTAVEAGEMNGGGFSLVPI